MLAWYPRVHCWAIWSCFYQIQVLIVLVVVGNQARCMVCLKPFIYHWSNYLGPKYDHPVFNWLWVLGILLGGMGHCFAWHVQVNLSFYFKFQIEKLAHHRLYAMLYLWLVEITKVRIRFQNYLFKADKRISHHLGPHRYFLLTELEYYCN